MASKNKTMKINKIAFLKIVHLKIKYLIFETWSVAAAWVSLFYSLMFDILKVWTNFTTDPSQHILTIEQFDSFFLFPS